MRDTRKKSRAHHLIVKKTVSTLEYALVNKMTADSKQLCTPQADKYKSYGVLLRKKS